MPQPPYPKVQSLAHLLRDRLFHIPDYQRSYSWSSREREDLFKDINGIANEGKDAEHFMATIVCLRRGNKTLGTTEFTKLEIVDGQQRLTTLIILLKEICRALDREKEGQRRLAEELQELLVKPKGDNLLLRTNHDASHYFANYMREGIAPSPDKAKTLSDKELLSAIQDCRKFVKRMGKEGGLLDLTALIKNRLSFILYEISDKKTVYTVFEVLNSRGMEVAWLDRLKSILMGEAFKIEKAKRGDELIQDLQTIWRDIYAKIGIRQGLNMEALRFAATLYSKTPKSELFSERDAVESLRARATDAKQIRKIAHWLLRVTEAHDEVMSNPRQDVVTRIAQVRLLAVAIYVRDFKDNDRKMLLDCWERVSFLIYGLHKKRTQTQGRKYRRLSWDICRSDLSPLSPGEIRQRIQKLSSDFPIKEAINGLRGNDCYNKWDDQLRYFLFRYEEHLATCNNSNANSLHWEHIWANNPSQSIEHIRPQSKAPEDIKHTLGNLMLLPLDLNRELRDRPPKEKLASYRRTGFHHADEVVKMLGQSPKWSRKICKQREKKLLRWAADEWGKGC